MNTIKINNVKKINKIKQEKVKRTKFWQGKQNVLEYCKTKLLTF